MFNIAMKSRNCKRSHRVWENDIFCDCEDAYMQLNDVYGQRHRKLDIPNLPCKSMSTPRHFLRHNLDM